MARKAKTEAAVAVIETPVAVIEAPVVANPFAALVAEPTAPTAPAKVHSITLGAETLKAANHVATFKGTRPVVQGGVSYTTTGLPYNPAPGHVNATQWAAVQAALAANGGAATVAQVAAAFTAAGLAAGLAAPFIKYRASGAKPNLEVSKA